MFTSQPFVCSKWSVNLFLSCPHKIACVVSDDVFTLSKSEPKTKIMIPKVNRN